MWTHTKIICTIGPAVSSYDKIIELIDAGMNVARLNFSHGTQSEHLTVINTLKRAREKKNVPLAIMLDTKGPEIRVGKIKNNLLQLEAGQHLCLKSDLVEGDESGISIFPEIVFKSIDIDTIILFDDGYITSKVVEKKSNSVIVEILNSGILKTHKGVNIPNVNIDLPAMTLQDVEDITFGCKHDVDIIAASFIRSADHVLEIKKLLIEQKKSDTMIIAKIENSLGIKNFEAIVNVADGIMVARGDLGVELPLAEVPGLQKMMIRKAIQLSKPIVTATQMLESMIKNPRPTRAEVSDVANAIYDSTSAVMLSGETAVGMYPIETVKMMKSIIKKAEEDFNYRAFFEREASADYLNVSSSVALAAVRTAYSTDAKAIFTFTNRGFTPHLISRFRPEMPIIALSSSCKTYHQLSFCWGIIPVDPSEPKNMQEAYESASNFALQHKFVSYSDLVVVTAGSPFGVSGATNMMIVDSIGDVLVRGKNGYGKSIHGQLKHIHSAADWKPEDLKDLIVVIPKCDASYASFLKFAAGIILQNHPSDHKSEKEAMQVAKILDIPLVVRADNSFTLLPDGGIVTLDPIKRVVYKNLYQ